MTTDEMVPRYLAGDSMKAIGAAAGISRQAVEQRLRAAKAHTLLDALFARAQAQLAAAKPATSTAPAAAPQPG